MSVPSGQTQNIEKGTHTHCFILSIFGFITDTLGNFTFFLTPYPESMRKMFVFQSWRTQKKKSLLRTTTATVKKILKVNFINLQHNWWISPAEYMEILISCAKKRWTRRRKRWRRWACRIFYHVVREQFEHVQDNRIWGYWSLANSTVH